MRRRAYASIGGIEVDSPPRIAWRAARDVELHEAVGDAVQTVARVVEVFGERDVREAAAGIAGDDRLQRQIESSATGLWDAVLDVVSPPRRRRGRWLTVLGVLAIAAGLAYVLTRDRAGGAGAADQPVATDAPEATDGR